MTSIFHDILCQKCPHVSCNIKYIILGAHVNNPNLLSIIPSKRIMTKSSIDRLVLSQKGPCRKANKRILIAVQSYLAMHDRR